MAEKFSRLNHPNLVKLYGITLNPLRMILEFVSQGDLFDLIHPKDKTDKEKGILGKISEKDFPMEYRLKIALDIAKGMLYLQSITPPIIHRDLRSPNIFVNFYFLKIFFE